MRKTTTTAPRNTHTPPRWFTITRPLGLIISLLGLLFITTTGYASADECPNEQFRTGSAATLPDCRAYELVSPVFKDGFPVQLLGLSPDGSEVRAESIGVFGGATPIEECPFNQYRFRRSSQGWTVSALNNVFLTEFDYSADNAACAAVAWGESGSGILPLHSLSQSVYESTLYLRRENGPPIPIGPQLPPSAVPAMPTGAGVHRAGAATFIDTTPDLSHVLFEIEANKEALAPGVATDLWPGDSTVLQAHATENATSLYEYSGTYNAVPTLVGVDNGGDLISTCGTYAGGTVQKEGNLHNAISQNGKVVFFTAIGADSLACGGQEPPVNELFARVNKANTTSISEPLPSAECKTSLCLANTGSEHESAFRDAHFLGANADGTKVFFMSAQQLLDGATQNSNNLYEYENPASPTGHLVLLSEGDTIGSEAEVQGVGAVSEDGAKVYFVARGILITTPRPGCLAELTSAELAEEEATNEGLCRPKKGENNLYVRDTNTNTTAFVATLASGGDEAQWAAAGGAPMNVTANGDFLVFTSTADLMANDSSTVTQVFRYDALTGELTRISTGDEMDDGNANVGEADIERAGSSSVEGFAVDAHPAVTESGETVVFKSSVALTPTASNNQCLVSEEGECFEYAENIYEWEHGRVYLISGGSQPDPPTLADPAVVSPSGDDIFFRSALPLVPEDGDTLGDIYDARVDGGFPALVTAAGCGGDTCQGAFSVPPAFDVPGSASIIYPGDQVPPSSSSVLRAKQGARAKKCKKDFVKKRGKCTRRKTKSKNKGSSRGGK
jgi:hypothetical protein